LKTKILALSLFLLLITIMVISISPPVQAVGEGNWITSYTIEDATSGQSLVRFDAAQDINTTDNPVIPGADVKVTFTVNVFTTGPDNLKLASGLSKSGSVYWSLDTSSDYDLGSSYNPNQATTEISWNDGQTFTMILYGKVPTSTSASTLIHVVTLSSASGGDPLDQINVLSTTSDLANYNTFYDQQVAKLEDLKANGVAQGYIDLYTNVLDASQVEATQGNVDNAIALLNALDVSNEPVGSTMEALFLPISGALAAVAVIFAFLFFRVRGRVSYFRLVVEDQIKDLEGLTMRARKLDRTMSSSLESVKDRLKRLVGM
jgi:hypothetical protein